jgi:glycosyltransferase involved in cell wall biosynthesis
MRLLIVTQAVDTQDPALGFFVGWIKAFSKKAASTTVICLSKGDHDLTIPVYSLGKEKKKISSVRYAWRFLRFIWQLRNEYDAVLIHMNQEYIIIGGWLWKLLGKRIYLWRNHYAGNLLTDIAVIFCSNVFCTSRHSYTAKYRKTMYMPVGVDLARFSSQSHLQPNSILFLARMAPSKHPDVLLEALGMLHKKGIPYTASFYGSHAPQDMGYVEQLKLRALELDLPQVTFSGSIPNEQTPSVYGAHEIYVNCAKSGMFDKTLFEASSCGALVLAVSEDFKKLAGEAYGFDGTARHLAEKLEHFLHMPDEEKEQHRAHLRNVAKSQDLSFLAEKLTATISAGNEPA